MIRVASPIRMEEDPADGREADERADDGGRSTAPPDRGCVSTAQFLGTASKKTKITTISNTMPREDAQAAEEILGDDANEGGGDQLADQHEQQDRVEEVGGVLDQAGQLPVRRGSSRPPGTCPPIRFIRTRLVSAIASTPDPGQQEGDDDDEDGVLGVEPRRREQW